MRSLASFAAAALLLMGCVPPAAGPGAPVTLRGTPAVVGSAPMNVQVTLRTDDGRNVTVVGPLAAELGRLSGATVEVEGRMNGADVEPATYHVVSVDGRPVHLGIVESAAGGELHLRLGDGSTIALGPGAGTLRPGQKVWVQGVTRLHVQTFGIVVP
jgi:hypothetical protein